ncbi:MAG: hypothetical protein OEY56_08505 [Cyclobacteriaceae bacterium]|nr:hypothetical protein [Cyclobacteriaceae bacterium]
MPQLNPRIGIALSAGVLLLLFVFPLWKISLVVPQYPKDIAILIHIDKIADVSPKALMILNVLNHNVGMKEIKPEEFRELTIFPIAVLLLVFAGLLSAYAGRRWMMMSWLLIALACYSVAFIDFYLWLYDFGHNLDPEAALKIEGQSFQPPVIGIRKVVNLEVHSFPRTGTLVVLASIVLGFYSYFKGIRTTNE